ncbi:hypothetical protein GCM10009413_12670 [Tatumella punctata]
MPDSITIGDFKEGMQITIDYWNIKQYYASWLSSLKEGIYGKNNATLVVSMYPPKDASFYSHGFYTSCKGKLLFRIK